MHVYSEDSLVEQPTIELFKELGWEAANCYHETFGPKAFLGRETAAEVVLVSRLRSALVIANHMIAIVAAAFPACAAGHQTFADMNRERHACSCSRYLLCSRMREQG